MKIVLNKCYGGFSLSEFACEKLKCDTFDYDSPKEKRVDEQLIDLVEVYGTARCSGRNSALVVVKIPDGFTDWEIVEYDGIEFVTYVIDGKIHHSEVV